jgi:hypothetical protein
MREKPTIKQLLLDIAEQDIPPDGDPWKAVRRRLKAQNGEVIRTKRQTAFILRRPKLAGLAAAALVLLAAIIFLTTPEGKVAAEGFLHLFTNTQKNSLPLPTGVPIEKVPPSLTPGLPDQETPTLKPTMNIGNYVYNLTLTGAQTLAQFPVRVPSSLPDGFQLSDITFDKQSQTVTQLCDYLPYAGPSISIQQSPTLKMQPIGPSAIINQFQLGDITVEWVDGGWFIPLGAAQQEWEPELPMRTYRWSQDGFYFTIWFIPTTASGPLTLDEMKAFVEIMIGAGSPAP